MTISTFGSLKTRLSTLLDDKAAAAAAVRDELQGGAVRVYRGTTLVAQGGLSGSVTSDLKYALQSTSLVVATAFSRTDPNLTLDLVNPTGTGGLRGPIDGVTFRLSSDAPQGATAYVAIDPLDIETTDEVDTGGGGGDVVIPDPPSPLVEVFASPNNPIVVPPNFIGIHLGIKSPSWIAGGATIPAPQYPFFHVRSLNSQAGGAPGREAEITFWSNIEITAGNYVWTAADAWINSFTQPVDWVFYGTPSFYSEHPTEKSMWPSWPGIGSAPTRANMSKIGDFIDAVLTRYAGRIRTVMLWNEPLFRWDTAVTEYGDAGRVTPAWAISAGIHGGGGEAFFHSSATQLANMGAVLKDAIDGRATLYGCGYQSAEANVTTRSVNAPVDLSGYSGTLGSHLDGLDGHYYDFTNNMAGIIGEISRYRSQTAPIMTGKPFRLSEGGIWNSGRPQSDIGKYLLGPLLARADGATMYVHNLQEDAGQHMGQEPLNSPTFVARIESIARIEGKTIVSGGRMQNGNLWVATNDGIGIEQ